MEKSEQTTEPPSRLLPPIFMIGKDSRGNWVVQEKSGACGGLFISRAEALKFVKFESGARRHAVVMVGGVFELDTSCARMPGAERRRSANVPDFRRVA